MLRAHPLRALSLGVSVESTLPIAAAECPSHAATIRKTEHQVRIEHVAEEVTPERDFEVSVDLAAVAPLTVVPHRRGPDGYFLLLLSPPDAGTAGLARALTPEGDPVDLILLADTSGSMDGAAREAQASFVEGLLSLLGPTDTFRLATYDREVRWFREEAATASHPAIADALAFLAARSSLGWTDLDAALAEASARAGPGTQVICLGDGAGTAVDPDPAEQARRIGSLAATAKGTFHAVSTGSSFEKSVLTAIAGIGGGSVREAGSDPADAATRLLAEIARPPVKDLAVSFSGVRTARVYPERLPNLPAGAQQAVLGRFLPAAAGTTGEVIVTGTLDGKPVRYTAPFALAAGETGNDFLPRLWARRHVDALLRETLTPGLTEEIVSFSSEFGILTPLTSLLVLESDADRERYGVTRRVAVRDGEALFATARDKVNAEVLRQAMREAGTWRKRLRARVLAEIAGLGRDLVPAGVAYGWGDSALFGAVEGGELVEHLKATSETAAFSRYIEPNLALQNEDGDGEVVDHDATPPTEEADEKLIEADHRSPATPPPPAGPALRDAESRMGYAGKALRRRSRAYEGGASLRSELAPRTARQGPPLPDISGLFPYVPPVPEEPKVLPAPAWPEEVARILDDLDRTPEIDAFAGALLIRQTAGRPHPLRDEWLSVSRTHAVYAAGEWLVEREHRGAYPETSWCRAGTRAAVRPDLLLGRKRPASENDRRLRFVGVGLPLHRFADGLRGHAAELLSRDGDLVTIRFSRPAQKREQLLVVDTARRVPVEQRVLDRGAVTMTLRWSEWTEVAGLPFAGLVEQIDAGGTIAYRTRTEASAPAAPDAAGDIARRVGAIGDVLFLGPVDPGVAAAKKAVGEDRAGFAERFVLTLDFAARGRIDEALAEWGRAKALVPDRSGADVLHAALLGQARRGEDLLLAIDWLAAGVANRPEAMRASVAETLWSVASNALGPNERLDVLTTLRDALPARDAEDAFATRLFDRRLAETHEELGEPQEALALREKLSREAPDDVGALAEQMDALARLGRRKEAIAAAERGLAREAKWTDGEAGMVHARLADLLWSFRRYPEFLAAVERWLARNPADQQAFERRLVGLLHLGRVDALDLEILGQLAAGPGDDPSSAAAARFRAALRVALGGAWNHWTNRIDESFVKPLGDAARHLARRDDPAGDLAFEILGDWRFSRLDEDRAIRDELRADLFSERWLAATSPSRLARFARIVGLGPDDTAAEDFAVLAKAVEGRFDRASDPEERRAFADLLVGFLDQRGDAERAAAFLRRRLASEPVEARHEVAGTLLDRTLRTGWAEERENEAFGLLPALLLPAGDGPRDPETESRLFAGAARTLADGLFAARVEAALGPVAEREKLPRTALAARTRAARTGARLALAARFREEAARAAGPLAPWLSIEALCFAAEAGRDPAAVEGMARESLLSPPVIPAPDLAVAFEERAALVLEYLATRRSADAGLSGRVVTLARERAAAAAEEDRETRRWRVFRLLLALDRPEELVVELRAFATTGRVEGFYRIALAYLLAERGALADAASELEAVAKADELPASGYATLAGWHLALGEDARRERALDRMLGETSEWELVQRVWQEAERTEGPGPDGVPASFDPEVLRVLRVLFTKAPAPAEHLHPLSNLYEATKDVRLLAPLADGIAGHSPEAIYPYLLEVRDILANVHEEATLDALATRIAERAAAAGTDTDRRGLLALGILALRRAAEVLNRPEAHAEAALAGLKEAFPAAWLPGEPRLYAGFLASLGKIPDGALATEQLRQLAEIHARADIGSEDLLAIAAARARTLWSYGRHDEALDVLGGALAGVRDLSGGRLPPTAFDLAGVYASWLMDRERFALAGSFLHAERDRQADESHKAWFMLRLFEASTRYLPFSDKATFFPEAFREIGDALLELPAEFTTEGVRLFCQFVLAGARAKVPDAAAQLAAYAREPLRRRLARLALEEQDIWATVADAVRQAGDPATALALLVAKLEGDPAWYSRANRDGWSRFVHLLARWRAEVKPEGELADRLARIAVDRLVSELRTGEGHGHGLWHRGSGWFWKERAEEFAAAARRVLELWPDSPSTVLRAAQYLWDGLDRKAEAVGALVALDGRGRLPDDGRLRIAHWLMELSRHGEAIPHLLRLVSGNPDRLDARCALVVCLHGTGRDSEGRSLADETEKLLRKPDRWTPETIRPLAEACFECGYHDRSARLFEEAVRVYERRRKSGGYAGAGDLIHCHGRMAVSLAALGRGEEAVAAAAAAVVVPAQDDQQRKAALDHLRTALAALPDLDAFAAAHAKKAVETGLDAPVLRKAFGEVFLARKEWAKAAEELRAARELSPVDREVHRLLVKALDQADDGPGALAALAEALTYSPADLALMEDLAERYESGGRAEEAERARTNYVEAEPLEANGHARLAKEREAAQRFDEAIARRRIAVRLRSFDPEVWFALVATLKKAGRPEEATAVLTEMMARPWSAEAGDVRARIAEALR
jgi:tetratricopeptide (TPR) repeat protein